MGVVNAIPGKLLDVAWLGAQVHLFVKVAGGHRIALVEKSVGQTNRHGGERVHLCFAPADCIVVPTG